MELWGAGLYGDPCGQCGWAWSSDAGADVETDIETDVETDVETDIEYVRSVPQRYARLLEGRSGLERHPELAWSVTGYVCHVGDNLRLWSERVAGVLRGGDARVGGYDPDALAAARGYERMSLPAALWSLQVSAAAWVQVLTEAVDEASGAGAGGVVLLHATRGRQRARDVASNNAHDAHHHAWDIARSLSS